MVLDCITRKIAGLPLTLLELNVITHVTCALMVYVCWWEKPHNVGQPITISETLLDHDSWALVYTMDKYGPMLQCAMEEPELPMERIAADDNNTSHDLDKIENPPPPTSAEPSINAAHGVSYHRGYTLDKRDLDSKQELDSYISTERELDICAAAARKMRLMIKDGSQLVACGEGLYPLSTPNVRMLYNQRTLDTTGNLAMLMVPLCLLYGGLHATALPDPNRTTTLEDIMYPYWDPRYWCICYSVCRVCDVPQRKKPDKDG